MLKETILPVQYPVITTSPDHTNYLSILGTKPDSFDWLFSNYIQIACKKWISQLNNSIFFAFGTEFMGKPFLSCPWIKTNIINPELVDTCFDIVSFLRMCIDNGYYVSIDINHFYLKCSNQYGKSDFIHTVFIFGYDDNTNFFHIADFFVDEKYSYELASYQEIQLAYENSKWDSREDNIRHDEEIILFKLLQEKRDVIEADYTLNIPRIINSIEEYLLVKNHNVISCSHDKFLYGIEVYDEIEKLLLNVEAGKLSLRKKLFHILYQHKLLMLKRIEYLNQRLSLPQNEYLYHTYKHIENEALTVRNISIKYMISHQNILLVNMRNRLMRLKELEVSCLPVLINSLQLCL